MFHLRVSFEFDDDFADRDDILCDAVGRESDWSGAGFSKRDAGWEIDDFDDAVAAKARIELNAPWATVSIREA